MTYSDAEIKEYIKQVVDETKSTARVDTGFLKRSIRGNLFGGMVTFREVFYGAYNGNSRLLENAQRIMPAGIPYRIVFVDEDGNEKTVKGKTRTGRTTRTSSISSGGRQTTNKIRALIDYIKNYGKAEDGAGA